MGIILRYVCWVPTDPPRRSPAADRPTRRPPRFGSTKGGGGPPHPKKRLHTPWGYTLAGGSPRAGTRARAHTHTQAHTRTRTHAPKPWAMMWHGPFCFALVQEDCFHGSRSRFWRYIRVCPPAVARCSMLLLVPEAPVRIKGCCSVVAKVNRWSSATVTRPAYEGALEGGGGHSLSQWHHAQYP